MVEEQQKRKRTPSQLVCPKIEEIGLYCGTASNNNLIATNNSGQIYNCQMNQMTFIGGQNVAQCRDFFTTNFSKKDFILVDFQLLSREEGN
ncbi:unnamed protein product [Meloidogyne enterolobii]|uniref:Uncharacterized protein n=1 Tax=Meloidogyne enterolobii TaxID=390850 RepID=A0ACB0ZGB2_MELEN